MSYLKQDRVQIITRGKDVLIYPYSHKGYTNQISMNLSKYTFKPFIVFSIYHFVIYYITSFDTFFIYTVSFKLHGVSPMWHLI